jgi:transposase-like protein
LFAHHVPEEAPKVASSQFHATHYYREQIDCALCHGYARKKLHVFTTEADDCLACHEKHEDKIHASNASDVSCLTCHTDSTANLEPVNGKCLFCHSENESLRAEIIQTGTVNVRHYPPSEESIKAASKIEMPENAPMQQFACHDCHKAHTEEDTAVRKYDSCINCHPRIESVGQHEMHMMLAGEADCTQCHQPHTWAVTEEDLETACGICHGEDITDPLTFISAAE